jgi:hypothetical protein
VVFIPRLLFEGDLLDARGDDPGERVGRKALGRDGAGAAPDSVQLTLKRLSSGVSLHARFSAGIVGGEHHDVLGEPLGPHTLSPKAVGELVRELVRHVANRRVIATLKSWLRPSPIA